jgi:hypothetical protein
MHVVPLLPPKLLRRAAFYLAIASFIAVFANVPTTHVGGDDFVYAMDDVYIHMALAKNLVLHGVWGVTPWEATNASSSPLWVELIALGFVLVGVKTYVPLVLAVASSLAVLAAADYALDSSAPAAEADGNGMGADARAVYAAMLALPAIVAFASLPALSLQGMEHPLHAALTLMAALTLSRAVGDRATPWLPGYMLLFVALPLLRYESLWLVMLGVLMLTLRRRYALAGLTLACGVVPIAALGLWWWAQGETFLPAAIMTKSIGPVLLAGDDLRHLVARFTWHPLQRLWSVPVLFVLWVTACGVLAMRLAQLRQRLLDRRWLVLLGLFALGAWIHATFATFGWGARYEAYLIVLGIVALGCWFGQSEERQAVAAGWGAIVPAALARPGGIGLLALLLGGFLYTGVMRLALVTRNAGIAAQEVRDRDMFIADFFAGAYPQQSVMAMNVGAIAWRGEPHLTDVLALGTPEVLRLFLRGELTPQSLDVVARARGVKVAAIFDDWFEVWTGGKPPWIAVAEIEPHADRPLNYTLYVLNQADARALVDLLRNVPFDSRFRTSWRLLDPYR